MQRILKHGLIDLDLVDDTKRMISIRFVVPCILMQSVAANLFKYGSVNNLCIAHPLVCWMPTINRGGLRDPLTPDHVINEINATLQSESFRLAKIYEALTKHINDPRDLIPMLPLGVYVDFKYLMGYDEALPFIESLEDIQVSGVSEIQWGVASIIQEVVGGFTIYPNVNDPPESITTSGSLVVPR